MGPVALSEMLLKIVCLTPCCHLGGTRRSGRTRKPRMAQRVQTTGSVGLSSFCGPGEVFPALYWFPHLKNGMLIPTHKGYSQGSASSSRDPVHSRCPVHTHVFSFTAHTELSGAHLILSVAQRAGHQFPSRTEERQGREGKEGLAQGPNIRTR